MGYRSNGAMHFEGRTEDLETAVALLRLQADDGMKEQLAENFIMNTSGEYSCFGFQFEGWKWYDGYDDIQALERIWGWFDGRGEDLNIKGAFVRIGEDDEDTETRYINDGYELLQVSRTYEARWDLDAKEDKRQSLSSTPDLQSTA